MFRNVKDKWCDRAIVANAEGATIIEYAIVLPVLLLLVLGIVEYSLILYSSSVLEGAVTFAARAGSTGYDGSSGDRQSYVYGLIQQRVSGLLDPVKLSVSSTSYADLSGVGAPVSCTNPAPPAVPTCPTDVGDPGAIVVYTATYPWPVVTPLLQNLIGTNGIFTLSSSAIVKNEPFPGT